MLKKTTRSWLVSCLHMLALVKVWVGTRFLHLRRGWHEIYLLVAAKNAVVGHVSCWKSDRRILAMEKVYSMSEKRSFLHRPTQPSRRRSTITALQRRARRTSSLSFSRSAAPRLLEVAVHPTQFGDDILFSHSLGQTLMTALFSAVGAWLPSCCAVRRWQGRKRVSGEEGWQWYA
jgi:hypothetical protein